MNTQLFFSLLKNHNTFRQPDGIHVTYKPRHPPPTSLPILEHAASRYSYPNSHARHNRLDNSPALREKTALLERFDPSL